MGVAGVGMSPLAELLLAVGHDVSGSDRVCNAGPVPSHLAALQRRGLRLLPQDGSGVGRNLAAVVISTAIEADNPDLQAAQKLGVLTRHRAQLLAELAAGHACAAIAGTAGKTTVTAMTGWILEQAGQDPTVMAGGALLNWLHPDSTACVRAGGPEGPWVLEVDESDRSLLNFHPEWAVITNISKDHFSLPELEDLFRQFASQARRGVIGCHGNPTNEELFAGLAPKLLRDAIRFSFRGREIKLPMPGIHNAQNAIHAIEIAGRFGVSLQEAAQALKSFKGVARRMEILGRPHGIAVIDDYAHNPIKIRAAWSALSACHERIFGVWRPHGFGPLRLMAEELEETFASVMRANDMLFILPVYYAGGTATKSLTSADFADMLARKGLSVEGLADPGLVERAVLKHAAPGDAVLIMGARDPELPVFAGRLAESLAQASVTSSRRSR